MKEIKKAYLVGFIRSSVGPGESAFANYISTLAPLDDSETWLIAELDVEVDIPTDDILQSQAVQALQRVRAVEVKKGLDKLQEIDSKISTLTAIEHQGAA